MNAKTLILVFALAAPIARAGDLPQDVDLLRKEFELDMKAAAKPLVLRYAAQLDALHRAALQSGDAKKAIAIEQEVASLRETSKIELPASALPGGIHPEAAPQMAGKWLNTSNGTQTFTLNPDGSITADWSKGHWTQEPSKSVLVIKWGTNRPEKWKIDEGGKVIHEGSGTPWRRVDESQTAAKN